MPQVQPQGTWVTPQGLPLPISPKHSPESLKPPHLPSCFGPHPPGSCSGCGPLPLPLLVGLVAADAMVSLLIVVVVFMCASPRDRPTQGESRDRAGPGVGVVSLGKRFPWRAPPPPGEALEVLLGKPWGCC